MRKTLPALLLAASVVVLVASVPAAAQDAPVYKPAEVDGKPRIVEKRLPLAHPPAALQATPFVVDFVIEPDGAASNLRVTSEPLPEPYTEEYLSLLRRWRFEPGRKGGAPVRVATRLTVSVESVTGGGRGTSFATSIGKPSPGWIPLSVEGGS